MPSTFGHPPCPSLSEQLVQRAGRWQHTPTSSRCSRSAPWTMEAEMEQLRGECVYVFVGVYSIKCKQGVPVLIYVSGQAGGSVWVSAGVRTWSEGKGPTNAEWQLIMPERYISICPPAQCLPLGACCCHQLFQQSDTHMRARTQRQRHDYLAEKKSPPLIPAQAVSCTKSNQREVVRRLEHS